MYTLSFLKQDCKPGSVSDNHLSMPYISIWLKPPAKEETGHLYPSLPLQALLRMGFTRPSDYPEAGELLPHHFALTHRKISAYGRYVSVALSLKLPSPGVTRHPLPRSPDFPHYRISPVPRLSVLHLFHYSTKILYWQEFLYYGKLVINDADFTGIPRFKRSSYKCFCHNIFHVV